MYINKEQRWGRDDVRPAWKRGTPQQRHFHMHTPLFGDFRVSGRGFGVGIRGRVSRFRAGVSGWGRDAVRSAWKRGTPQQGHFHMHTPLFGNALELYNYASGHGM